MNEFDEMDCLALQVRMDYGFMKKKLDVISLAEKLNILLVKYSLLTEKQRNCIVKECQQKDALTIYKADEDGNREIFLFYNDAMPSERIRFSIAHEIKHIVCDERNADSQNELMADHFARELLAPSCLIIQGGYEEQLSIVSDFDISYQSAGYVLSSARNRVVSSQFKLSKTEKEFIELYNTFN